MRIVGRAWQAPILVLIAVLILAHPASALRGMILSGGVAFADDQDIPLKGSLDDGTEYYRVGASPSPYVGLLFRTHEASLSTNASDPVNVSESGTLQEANIQKILAARHLLGGSSRINTTFGPVLAFIEADEPPPEGFSRQFDHYEARGVYDQTYYFAYNPGEQLYYFWCRPGGCDMIRTGINASLYSTQLRAEATLRSADWTLRQEERAIERGIRPTLTAQEASDLSANVSAARTLMHEALAIAYDAQFRLERPPEVPPEIFRAFAEPTQAMLQEFDARFTRASTRLDALQTRIDDGLESHANERTALDAAAAREDTQRELFILRLGLWVAAVGTSGTLLISWQQLRLQRRESLGSERQTPVAARPTEPAAAPSGDRDIPP